MDLWWASAAISPRNRLAKLQWQCSVVLAVLGVAFCSVPVRADDTFTVTSAADDGSAGTLRWAINQANAAGAGNHSIDFSLASDSSITLASALPMLSNTTGTIAINGAGAPGLSISGNGASRIFFVEAGEVSIANVNLTGGSAVGGAGGTGWSGGGGGLGAGGALFVNTGATVTVQNVTLDHNSATGGAGGAHGTFSTRGGGGGGGFGGNGGAALQGGGGGGGFSGNGGTSDAGGGGGGGFNQAGGDASFFDGGAGSGGAAGGTYPGGNGQSGDPGGGGGGGARVEDNAFGGDGGNGGLYGGGGGAGEGTAHSDPGIAGMGGDFGGGGGGGFGAGFGGYSNDYGGPGGFGGGGGGGGFFADYIAPGGFGAGDGGIFNQDGRGGSGFGGALFVREGGSLTILDSSAANDNSVTGGTGQSNGIAAGSNLYLMSGVNASFGGTGSSFSGSISGDGGVTINSSGTTTFLGLNNYTGGTTVSSGVLLGNSNSLQGAITNNAQVTFDQSVTGTYAGNMDGAGSLLKTGNGNLILSGTNSYTGGTTVSTGILTGTTNSLRGAITNNAQVSFDQNFDGSYSGAMSGAGSLVKLGTGNLTLVGVNPFSGLPNNNYTGGTTVSAGILTGTSYSLQGNILNNAQVVFDQNQYAWTFGGNISGTGSVVVEDGVVEFTGINSYTGGTTVIGATMAGDSTNLQGNIAQDSDSSVIFFQSSDGTYSGNLTGSGNLYKYGAGSLSLTGTNAADQVQIGEGRFAVNGTLSAGNVIVQEDGVLGGNGTINGNVVNVATVAPGNSIGTLTINGDYMVANGGNNPAQQVEINAGGNTPGVNNDLLVVNGLTTILGATVDVQAAAGAYTEGTKYTFLETASLSGAYSGVTGFSDPNLHAVLGYGTTDVGGVDYITAYLMLVNNQSDFAAIATTFNQRGVATYLDDNSTSASPELQAVIDTLYTLPVPEQQAALNMMTAEVNGTLAQLQVQETAFLYMMLRRRVGSAFVAGGLVEGQDSGGELLSGSSTKHSGSIMPVSYNASGSSFADTGEGSIMPASLSTSSSPWSGWSAGYGLGGNAQSDGNAAGGVYGSGGSIIALERPLDDRSLCGLFGGYSGLNLQLRDLRQSATANQGQFGGYFLRDMDSTYLLAAGSAGFTSYRESRQMTFGNINATASGSSSGWNPSAYLEQGLRVPLGNSVLQPYAALQYIYVRQDSFTETGAGTLNQSVAGIDTNALRGILGSRLSRSWQSASGRVFIPEVRAAWMHEFLEPSTTLNAVFAPVGGGSFATRGLNFGRDWALLGVGTQYVFNQNVSLFANYDVQVNAFQAWHAGSGGLQFTW